MPCESGLDAYIFFFFQIRTLIAGKAALGRLRKEALQK
jgi:hypothetical protein